MVIEFQTVGLTASEQSVVTRGFDEYSVEQGAPAFEKEQVKWLFKNDDGTLQGALTADILWDWIYLDELWVSAERRGEGLGRALMQRAEAHATSLALRGVWLWTQSWQAAEFYRQLGYEEFARFDDFPRGHTRLGFRKTLN
ncbi:MAG: GNAT family N-acetyltransferase [Pseudomonadota bacterium]